MSQEKPNTYTAEFRASAVKLANESDKPITQVAKDLGINVNTLHTWISKYSRPTEHDKTVRTDEHLYDELKRLKKEVARLTEERDLLKKAQRTLPRSSGEVRLDHTPYKGVYCRCDVSVPAGFPKRLL
jgi:transposase